MKPGELQILFNDDHLLAVMKPAGLATIPGRAEADSVLQRLGRQIGLPTAGTTDPRLRLVHRLDKETSGVLLFALHSAAQRLVSHQFQNNTVVKEYLALVCGQPPQSSGRIEADLAPHPTDKLRMAVVRHGGRRAVTEWQVEACFRGAALLRCFPKTGKTHQIRVHLKYLGHPLLIDSLYHRPLPGVESGLFLSRFKKDYKRSGAPERPLIDRLTLHAQRLRLQHPDGSTLDLEAPLPKDFRAAINMLSRYSRA